MLEVGKSIWSDNKQRQNPLTRFVAQRVDMEIEQPQGVW